FLARQPSSPGGHETRGDLLLAAGRASDAAAAFERVTALVPRWARGWQRLGSARLADDDLDGAAQALEHAAVLGLEDVELFAALAEIHARRGDVARQVDARRRAVDLLLVDLPGSEAREPRSAPALRRRLITPPDARPPYPQIAPQILWLQLTGSLSLDPATKLDIAQALAARALSVPRVLRLARLLDREAEGWRRALGPHAAAFQARIADAGTDPGNPESLLALRTHEPTDAALLLFVAGILRDATRWQLELLEAAYDSDPADSAAAVVDALGRLIADRVDSHDDDARSVLLGARRLAERILAERPSWTAHQHAGLAVRRLASLSSGAERARHLTAARDHYAAAAAMSGDETGAAAAVVHHSWGLVLDDLADLAEDAERAQLLHEACERYRAALVRRHDHDEALYSWDIALSKLAEVADHLPDDASDLEAARSAFADARASAGA
ncbi:MAG: hypothetical protein AAF772_03415, partial [Acidobacteriota bacterium]